MSVKKWMIVGIGLTIIGAILTGIATASYVFNSEGKETKSDSKTLTGEFSKIEIDVSVTNTNIIVEDIDQPIVEYKNIYTEREIKSEIKDGKLIVSQGKQWMQFIRFGFISDWITGDASLTIRLPQKKYSKADINLSIGTTIIENLIADEIDFETGAGEAKVSAWADKFIVNTGAGRVELDILQNKGKIKYLSLSSGAGDITIKNAATEEFRMESGVGALVVEGLSGKGHINTGVGSAKINIGEWNNDIEIETGVGECTLILPEKSGFELDADSGLGDIFVNVKHGDKQSKETITGDTTKHYDGEGMHKIRAKTGVGRFNIKN